jgi:hypothetical protein
VTVQLYINSLEGRPPGPLPPQAQPAGVSNREPELREWQAIEHIYRERLFEAAHHTGLLSPMFPAKTGVSFAETVAFVEDNPGHDVYFIDHGAQFRYYNYNLLEQCEHILPGYYQRFTQCYGLIGIEPDFATLGRSLPETTINGNGWIGNVRFWREVVGEAVRLIGLVRQRPALWRFLCEPAVFNGTVYPYMPFIFERFVTYWMMTRGGFSVKAWPYDKAYVLDRCVRVLERPIVQGFHDLFNQWDAEGPWSPDRREFMRDLSRAVFRQWRSANDHMVYPWSGERIAPVS